MVEQVEQPADEQDKGIKEAEIYNNNSEKEDKEERGSRDRVYWTKSWS